MHTYTHTYTHTHTYKIHINVNYYLKINKTMCVCVWCFQGDVVSVTFVAGNPRNSGDIRDKTFVTVEIYDNRTDTWEVVHTDASWETRFHWLKASDRQSNVTVEWHVPPSARGGRYRIRHSGHYKQLKGLKYVITPYEGSSDIFRVAHSFYTADADV
ncbi:hypothetical protein LDENG_00200600 [Lucifuga dentata]|nr:hypothetical protein LDENG_00200600 [Lucifuga dentata]